MKRLWILFGMLLTLCSLILTQPVQADEAEKEARAVFVKMVNAAKASNSAEFKTFISQEDLKEMDAEGFTDMMMMMMAGENPEQFKADVKGDQIVFTKEVKQSGGGGNSTETTTVHMIKEGGQWKFGKPKEAP
ncbi:MAG TPA: hypothetical protein DCZ69_07835 [Syntrophobacteraceae bacterium]|nr:hypothetical protein [Syntrophobacteraceae bacterium]HBZ56141.1 hypothetical protein [Syntrophobacteraceae bacterium]